MDRRRSSKRLKVAAAAAADAAYARKLRRERPPKYENESPLFWRVDPKRSHSDWTIEVEHDDHGKGVIDIYHVHKIALTLGKRRSEYFTTAFKAHERFQEKNNETTKYRASSSSEAKVFPTLLDFLYGISEPNIKAAFFKNIDTVEDLECLFALGDYFIIPSWHEMISLCLQDSSQKKHLVRNVLENSKDWIHDSLAYRLADAFKFNIEKLYKGATRPSFHIIQRSLDIIDSKITEKWSFSEKNDWSEWIAKSLLHHLLNEPSTRITKAQGLVVLRNIQSLNSSRNLPFDYFFAKNNGGKIALIYLTYKFGKDITPEEEEYFKDWLKELVVDGHFDTFDYLGGSDDTAKVFMSVLPKDILMDMVLAKDARKSYSHSNYSSEEYCSEYDEDSYMGYGPFF